MIPVDQSQHRPEAIVTLLDAAAAIKVAGGYPLEVLACAIESYERGEYLVATLLATCYAMRFVHKAREYREEGGGKL